MSAAIKVNIKASAQRAQISLMRGIFGFRGDVFLGVGERSPVMQNGRLPGTPVRGYSTEYAKRLDLVRARFGGAL